MTARRRRNPAPRSIDLAAVLVPGEARRRAVRRAMAATARIIVRLRKLDAAIDDDPSSQTLTTQHARLEGQLTRNCDALGLTPRAAAALGITKLDAAERVKRMAEQGLSRYALGER
jgi:hypothetical protein